MFGFLVLDTVGLKFIYVMVDVWFYGISKVFLGFYNITKLCKSRVGEN